MKQIRLANVLFLNAVLLLCCSFEAAASITEFGSEKFRLSRSQNPQLIEWSPTFQPDADGLRLLPNKHEYDYTEFWLQSQPFPIGGAWRPPSAAALHLGFDGNLPKEFWSNSTVYFRYSTDKVHWSTWRNANTLDADDKGYDFVANSSKGDVVDKSTFYEVGLSQPSIARAEYQKLYRVWMKSREYADNAHLFCLWLAKHDATYFEREIPFIGYIQFRVEGNTFDFKSPVKLRSIYLKYVFSISGLGYFNPIDAPDDNTAGDKRAHDHSTGAWHFDLDKVVGSKN